MTATPSIKSLLASEDLNQLVTVRGWVRAFRNEQFVALNDGSTAENIQIVAPLGQFDELTLKRISVGAAIEARGTLIASQGKGQRVEVIASEIIIIGDCDAGTYPIQPKKHSLEFLRDNAHLRFRTNTFAAVMRIRHHAAMGIHRFFDDRGFFYLHSPIITGSDAEGAGEMFRISTLDPINPPKSEDGSVDYTKDFFGKQTNLTVSGQLEAELGALAMSKVYTFGPTFRAENSNTSRHLAEFWMIEPEIAFADLDDDMNLAEDMLQYVISYVLERVPEDIKLLNDRQLEEEKSKPQKDRSELSLLERLEFVIANPFQRLTYTEAIDILKNCNANKKKQFQYLIEDWGADLQSEHERYLVEKHFKKPVILTDYPKDIKAFYMRLNEDGKTVRAMDILFPGIGEIVGGSQREERLDHLTKRMTEMHISHEELHWYLDTRRFGTCPHAGFGLGFERLVLFITGMGNIRDVIPFPRTPGNAAF
jgi:asparaginyl-tRNA synthetase